MTTLAPNYLDPAVLAAVGSLDLRARMIVEGLMTGMHRSPLQGFSVEFAQHRQYAPGDDLRHLDWKVFGRTDKLYLKQYQKETNLDLVLLMDVSGSMGYGGKGQGPRAKGRAEKEKAAPRGDSPGPLAAGPRPYSWSKFDHGASLAAALSYLALRQQDRVGLILFDDQLRDAVRASNARDHWRTIVGALSGVRIEPLQPSADGQVAQRGTDLGRLFDQVAAQLGQRSLVVLISDLFDDPVALERGLARISHRRHDLVILQVLDHAELNFPFRDPSEFIGLEGEGRLKLDPHALRRGYLDALRQHLIRIEQAARQFRFDHLMLDTSEPLGPPLSHLLARRAAAASKGRK